MNRREFRMEEASRRLNRLFGCNGCKPKLMGTSLNLIIDKNNTTILDSLISMGIDLSIKDDCVSSEVYTVPFNLGVLKISHIRMLMISGAQVHVDCIKLSEVERDWLTGVMRLRDSPPEEAEEAAKNTPRVAKFLIGHLGNEPDPEIKPSTTLLHLAALLMDLDSITTLLELGADVKAADVRLRTPLHYVFEAMQYQPDLDEIIKIIVIFAKFEADFFSRSSNDSMPIEFVMNNYQDSRYQELCKAIIEHGDYHFNCTQTYAHPGRRFPHTAFYGPLECCQKLSLLHIACKRGDLGVVKYLLKNGADLNCLDHDEWCPIFYALHGTDGEPDEHGKCTKLFKYLLTKNPRINYCEARGWHILALRWRHPYPDYLWQPILQHLAKTAATKEEIHQSIKTAIQDKSSYKDYFRDCLKELEEAQKDAYTIGTIKVYNLIADPDEKLVKYAGNQNIFEYVNKPSFVDDFPIYGSMVRARFEKGKTVRKVYEEAAVTLRNTCLPYRLDPMSARQIVEYCTVPELENLCQSIDGLEDI